MKACLTVPPPFVAVNVIGYLPLVPLLGMPLSVAVARLKVTPHQRW